MEITIDQEQELLNQWERIGAKNYWIQEAVDPAFSKEMLTKCNTVEELEAQIKRGNWCLGQGFYYLHLCFINQINGGDEWLAISYNKPFDSITFERIIERGAFELYIQQLLER